MKNLRMHFILTSSFLYLILSTIAIAEGQIAKEALERIKSTHSTFSV